MAARPYRRRATGEMAIDPALYELVINSGALLDRLICACPSPIAEEAAAPSSPQPEAAPAAGAKAGKNG
jgi:hypothetical protein